MSIRTRVVPLLLAAIIAVPAFAAPTSKAPTAQQQRMAQCSAQNKGKKGADFRASQSACLKGGNAVAGTSARATPQQRMARCSAQNKGRKGADYKAAQSACLKGNA